MSDSFSIVYRTAGWDDGFPIWGTAHLLWLAGFLAFLLILLPLYLNAGEKGRRWTILTLTSLLLADELAKHAFLLIIGEEDVDYLPLHLCSIGLFICIWYAVHPNPWAGELLFAVSLPGAAVALLFPGWSCLPPLSFLSIHSFTFHILLAAIPLCLLVSGEIRPSAKRLWFCFAFLVVTAIPVWFIDRKYGTNFYFLTYPGTGNPLTWFESKLGTPGYLVGLPICLGVVWTGMYGIVYLVRGIMKMKNE